MRTRFDDHLLGALLGVAIGDGMGAPVEGLTPGEIARRFPSWDWTVFLPTQEWKPKGHGRITDDTLMTEALMRAYQAAGDHLDAAGFRDHLLPELCERMVWVPERQQDLAIIDRLNFLERYAVIRLRQVGAEPRIAGVGNGLNCAIAMFIMPVGAVNAGDPAGAYREAAELGMAESHSFAVEGAAALAAGYAAALAQGADVASVLAAAHDHARDGTRSAIAAALAASDPGDAIERWIERVLLAIQPFVPSPIGVGETPLEAATGGRHPTVADPRLAVEEVAVALAALRWGGGDFLRTLEAGVRFGRDADSIAGMACGLCGAVVGASGVPAALAAASATANRRDWAAQAGAFAAACRGIHARDALRWAARGQALG